MNAETHHYFWVTMLAMVLPFTCLSIYLSLKQKRLHRQAENKQLNEQIHNLQWYMSLNIGALLLTPIWTLANGFVISTVLYVVFAVLWPPLNLLMAVFFFIHGNKLSWSDGARWNHDFNTFLDDQFFWTALGLLTVLMALMAIL